MKITHPVMRELDIKKTSVGVIGLGYVGLPLAAAFAKKFKTVAFDISEKKVDLLNQGIDYTNELADKNELKNPNLFCTTDLKALLGCKVIIVAVPTPIDMGNKPDLAPILSASKTVAAVLKMSSHQHYICYESTVYPGCTEEECLTVIENYSTKKHGEHFFLGYSPERINPGDKEHRLETIIKVVSGCNEDSSTLFAELYSAIVTAGVHIAPSIKVAEAAKVIENTQRDLNIALVNELSLIFHRLDIDTKDVLAASGTKWNFLKFTPGLVGGHCIGVDPYYLTYKAESVGYIPRVILSGRAVNDSMGEFISSETVKLMLQKQPKNKEKYHVLLMGFTFKENVADTRNTKVIDIYKQLKKYNLNVDIVDPVADAEEALHEYQVSISKDCPHLLFQYDAFIFAVPHAQFADLKNKIISLAKEELDGFVFMDIKSNLTNEEIQIMKENQKKYWRL